MVAVAVGCMRSSAEAGALRCSSSAPGAPAQSNCTVTRGGHPTRGTVSLAGEALRHRPKERLRRVVAWPRGSACGGVYSALVAGGSPGTRAQLAASAQTQEARIARAASGRRRAGLSGLSSFPGLVPEAGEGEGAGGVRVCSRRESGPNTESLAACSRRGRLQVVPLSPAESSVSRATPPLLIGCAPGGVSGNLGGSGVPVQPPARRRRFSLGVADQYSEKRRGRRSRRRRRKADIFLFS